MRVQHKFPTSLGVILSFSPDRNAFLHLSSQRVDAFFVRLMLVCVSARFAAVFALCYPLIDPRSRSFFPKQMKTK